MTLSDATEATFGPVSTEAVVVAESRLEMSPNPASGPIRVDFTIPRAGPVRIHVDVAGRVVSGLIEEFKAPGRYSLLWDGRKDSGSRVSAGIYFVRMVAPDRVLVRSLALVPSTEVVLPPVWTLAQAPPVSAARIPARRRASPTVTATVGRELERPILTVASRPAAGGSAALPRRAAGRRRDRPGGA